MREVSFEDFFFKENRFFYRDFSGKLIELRFAEHKKREQERDEHDFADRRSELEGNSIFGLGSQINRRIMNPSPSMHELLELERNKGMVLEKTLDVALAEVRSSKPKISQFPIV
jgi:hypothetical protein